MRQPTRSRPSACTCPPQRSAEARTHPRQWDGLLLGVCPKDGEPADNFLGLCKRPIGHRYLPVGVADARTQSGRQAAFGSEQPAGLHALLHQFAHFGHFLLRGGSASLDRLINAQEFHGASPCFEFGVAMRTGHDLLKSVKRRTRKARSLQVRRTTLFEIDKSNDLFFRAGREATSHPDAHVAKALLASLGPKSSSLQSVRCAAYPHEIVHDDGTPKGS